MKRKKRNYSGRTIRYYNLAPNLDRGHKEYLKLYLFKKGKMSRAGYLNWNKRMRPRVYKEVTIDWIRVDAPLEEINTKQKLLEFIYNNVGTGTFVVNGFGNAKTVTGVKPYPMCKVVIREMRGRFHGVIIKDWRLHRYKWFMQDV